MLRVYINLVSILIPFSVTIFYFYSLIHKILHRNSFYLSSNTVNRVHNSRITKEYIAIKTDCLIQNAKINIDRSCNIVDRMSIQHFIVTIIINGNYGICNK